MEKARIRPLVNAYRILNPGCVVLITVGDGTRDNLFPVTWNMPVRKDPPMVGILSSKRHFSYSFIAKTGEFGVNVPTAAMGDAVLGCGRTSGRDVEDKFERFGLTRRKATRIRAPLVEQAVANLQCRVCQVVDLGASSLLLAQVLEAEASTEHFQDGQWRFVGGLQLLHHLGGDQFCISDRAVTATVPLRAETRVET